MDQLAGDFLFNPNETTALLLLKNFRTSSNYFLGIFVGEFFHKLFPKTLGIIDELAMCHYYVGNYEKSYDLYAKLLSFPLISDNWIKNYEFNAHFSAPHIKERYAYYNKEVVNQLLSRPKKEFPMITLSVTTCKRLDLFVKTMNSFLNCCTDLDKIDEWMIVDDNSSDEDRKKMKELYSFCQFYDKNIQEKGHPRSMNIITKSVKTPYLFHMEDDWLFFVKRSYISDCLDVIQSNQELKQCLINKNFAETENDHRIAGGMRCITESGLRYYIHQYIPANTPEWNKFMEDNKGLPNCAYWPHFSFRPSLIRTEIFKELGEFDEKVNHFEMEYSWKYYNKGYRSAFLPNVSCLHTGRLTSERWDKSKPNAYDLNGEAQFAGKETIPQVQESLLLFTRDAKKDPTKYQIRTVVINLDRRSDRWESFNKVNGHELNFLNYERYSAVDGKALKSTYQLQRIFDGNDYNWRRGMIGCAMSHIKLCVELLKSDHDAYLVIEDDILSVVPDFEKKFRHAFNQLKNQDWNLFYLGHHMFKKYITEETTSKEKYPTCEKWSRNQSLTRSIGGTIGYLINKDGAKKLLEYINETGMVNCIDTMQQKSADKMNVFYCSPHLLFSECWTGNNIPDTDIQFDFDNLKVPVEKRIEEEKMYYDCEIVTIPSDPNVKEPKIRIFMWNGVKNSVFTCPHYSVEDRAVIVIPEQFLTEKIRSERHINRLMKYYPDKNLEEFCVDDALKTT